jgi:hypothetical protein
MEPSAVLVLRKYKPLTPYIAEAWERALCDAKVLDHFAKIPEGFRTGFILDFPIISHVQIPLNKDSINQYLSQFNSIIQKELQKNRYIGPFSHAMLKHLIGPFHSSPMSIIPKLGRLDEHRLVQNFSFLHSLSRTLPNPSINSFIDVNRFPTTWGKFSIIYLLIARLPEGSEVAT